MKQSIFTLTINNDELAERLGTEYTGSQAEQIIETCLEGLGLMSAIAEYQGEGSDVVDS